MKTTLSNQVAHPVALGDRGSFVIPAEVRLRHGWDKGSPLVSIDTEEGFLVMSADRALDLIRESFKGRDPVAELLADRKDEVDRLSNGRS